MLSVARLTGRAAFSTEELDMAAGFANQASIAIELADARTEQQRCVMDDERDRIAADLHDHVIQRLFATGLALQSIAATLPPDTNGSRSGATAAARLTGAIQDLDDTIRRIRSTIFALHHLAQPADGGLRGLVLDVITEVTPALGFTPAFRVDGPVDTLTPAWWARIYSRCCARRCPTSPATPTPTPPTSRSRPDQAGSPSTSTTTAPASTPPTSGAAA